MQGVGSEVEIKFWVADLGELEAKLPAAGFRLGTPRTLETNTLFDLPNHSLGDRGQVLRIRRYGNAWTVTHKSKAVDGRHKTRREIETSVADGEPLAAIFAALGLVPSFRYEKYRSQWSDGTGDFVLDETPIGNLAEIEGPPEWIDRTAARLGVAPADYLTDSYVGLFFAWKRRTGSSAEEMTFAAIQPKK
jgi:adenylate cyclase class 2